MHTALHRLNILPSTLLAMSDRERAFIYASLIVQAEEEKKEQARMKGKFKR